VFESPPLPPTTHSPSHVFFIINTIFCLYHWVFSKKFDYPIEYYLAPSRDWAGLVEIDMNVTSWWHRELSPRFSFWLALKWSTSLCYNIYTYSYVRLLYIHQTFPTPTHTRITWLQIQLSPFWMDRIFTSNPGFIYW